MAEHATIGQGSTGIEWCTKTWNPVHGCSKVSPGCAHCYAETQSLRFGHTSAPWTPANAPANVLLKPHKLDEPLRWRKPEIVFVNSMSDLFHEDVPHEYIDRVFAVMAKATQHTFQVLTKRPLRMQRYITTNRRPARVAAAAGLPDSMLWPPANVWLGVSIENRRFVDRADVLRETPAAVRFISAEPLLGPLVYDDFTDGDGHPATAYSCWSDGADLPQLDLTGIDWLIVGGESGAGHRPIREEWVHDLRDTCLATGRRCENCGGAGGYDRVAEDTGEVFPALCGECQGRGRHGGTAFFFKQVGGLRPKSGGRLLDGLEWNEMPEVRR